MITLKKYSLLIILFIYPILSFGQFVRKVPLTEFTNTELKSTTQTIPVSSSKPISSLALRIHPDDGFSNAYIVAANDTFVLTLNEHADSIDFFQTSNLIIFDKPLTNFVLVTGEDIHNLNEIDLFFIYAPPVDPIKQERKKKTYSENCSAPDMVDQSIWRDGLPAPDYSRIVTDAHNIIIHHSAGSNTNSNYTDVIRNIYLYHTGVHGWSDIGYNYVIAQDGTIFKARDPGPYAQDSVMGAHFCSSNSGTMGICVLGTYVDVDAPQPALTSLEDLLTWKLYKDTLNPMGIFSHALNPELHTIAGHRDGCSTQCPGDKLYQELSNIRLHTLNMMESCGYILSNSTISNRPETYSLFPNPAKNNINIKFPPHTNISSVFITNLLGQQMPFKIQVKSANILNLNVQLLPQGQYYIHFFVDDQKHNLPFLIF